MAEQVAMTILTIQSSVEIPLELTAKNQYVATLNDDQAWFQAGDLWCPIELGIWNPTHYMGIFLNHYKDPYQTAFHHWLFREAIGLVNTLRSGRNRSCHLSLVLGMDTWQPSGDLCWFVEH